MKFTKEEVNYIIDNYKYKTIKEMATQLILAYLETKIKMQLTF